MVKKRKEKKKIPPPWDLILVGEGGTQWADQHVSTNVTMVPISQGHCEAHLTQTAHTK